MARNISEEENRIINLLVEDADFFTNARKYRTLLNEWGRRDSGDTKARPLATISSALDSTVSERRQLDIVKQLGADSRLLGLAYQRAAQRMASPT